MDLTICVMLPPRGDTDYARSGHSKMPVLSPVCVYPLQTIDEVHAQRTGYIHVTDCPVKSAQELAEQICIPDIRVDENSRALAKRLYEADVSLLPAKVYTTLLNERQCSLTWNEFASMYSHRVNASKLSDVVVDRK